MKGIIPAYAGSTPPWPADRRRLADHPRIRGEHIKSGFGAIKDGGSSPHTRGALRFRSCCHRRRRIIPAYAGSTQRVPHEQYALLGSSPHTRGARPPEDHVQGHRRIIPAYAGSTPYLPCGTQCRPDHPRIRGEHQTLLLAEFRDGGSSPHTRGALVAVRCEHERHGIIPAYAGSTERLTYDKTGSYGSSPHTRGARSTLNAMTSGGRIIPAYAGSTSISIRRLGR